MVSPRLLTCTLALAVCAIVTAQPFHLVGLPPGTRGTWGTGVSYDGTVAVGASALTPPFPGGLGPGWSWSTSGGLQAVTGPGLLTNSGAYGISGDGNFVLGETGVSPPTDSPTLAYRYNRSTGQADNVGVLPGGFTRSRATSASADGSVVAGFSADRLGSFERAFRWTAETGIQPLPVGTGGYFQSETCAVSADGQTIVGWANNGTTVRAMRWTGAGSFSVLPALPGFSSAGAYGLNSTGTIAVGDSSVTTGSVHATMWDGLVPIDLGVPMGYFRSAAYGVDDTGSVIVGHLVRNDAVQVAAIWLDGSGWHPLDQYLTSIGVTVPAGTPLHEVTGISRDGRTLLGTTWVLDGSGRREGFVVTIPSPPACGLAAYLLGWTLCCRRRRN